MDSLSSADLDFGRRIEIVYHLFCEVESSLSRLRPLKDLVSEETFIEIASLRRQADERLLRVLEELAGGRPSPAPLLTEPLPRTGADTPSLEPAQGCTSYVSSPSSIGGFLDERTFAEGDSFPQDGAADA